MVPTTIQSVVGFNFSVSEVCFPGDFDPDFGSCWTLPNMSKFNLKQMKLASCEFVGFLFLLFISGTQNCILNSFVMSRFGDNWSLCLFSVGGVWEGRGLEGVGGDE